MSRVFPESPAGHKLAWLIAKISGEPVTEDELEQNLSDRLRQVLSAERLARMSETIRSQFGEVKVSNVVQNSPHSLIAAIQGSVEGAEARLPLDVEPDSPHRITSATVTPAPPLAPGAEPLEWKELAARAPRPASESSLDSLLASAIDETLENTFAEGRLVGLAAGIVKDGRLVHFRSIGVTDHSRNIPITPTTTFRIGSVSKTLTAMGVMTLVEKGKLGLDDPVNDHLQKYEIEVVDDSAPGVTVRHLLTHSGGLISRPGEIGVPEGSDVPTLNQFYSSGLQAKEVGKTWAYSNDGYSTLGQIVEDVSGEPFDRYMVDNVFDPLGMTSTDYSRSERVGEVSAGYTEDFSKTMPVQFMEVIVTPAGGVFSNVEDMTRCVEAICGYGANSNGRVLQEETFKEMITPHLPTGSEKMSMGFGFVLTEFDDHRIAWHNGGWHGATSEMWVAPDDGWGVLLFTPSFLLRLRDILDRDAAALLRLVLSSSGTKQGD